MVENYRVTCKGQGAETQWSLKSILTMLLDGHLPMRLRLPIIGNQAITNLERTTKALLEL